MIGTAQLPAAYSRDVRVLPGCGSPAREGRGDRRWTGTRLFSAAPAGGVCDRDEHRQKPYRAVSAVQRDAASAFTAPIVAQRPWVRIWRRTEAGRAQRAAASSGQSPPRKLRASKKAVPRARGGASSPPNEAQGRGEHVGALTFVPSLVAGVHCNRKPSIHVERKLNCC